MVALGLIAVYVIGTGAADVLSELIGMEKLVTLLFYVILSTCMLVWIKKKELLAKYGLCRPRADVKRFWYYLPLAILSSSNLWFGVQMNMTVGQALRYTACMLCVGFLEELIFRGFLFRAIERRGALFAVIVSGVTFGLGHAVNLLNGDADPIKALCQIAYAAAFGILFATVFYFGGSLIPCIASHCTINCLAAFANERVDNGLSAILLACLLCISALGYVWILYRKFGRDRAR